MVVLGKDLFMSWPAMSKAASTQTSLGMTSWMLFHWSISKRRRSWESTATSTVFSLMRKSPLMICSWNLTERMTLSQDCTMRLADFLPLTISGSSRLASTMTSPLSPSHGPCHINSFSRARSPIPFSWSSSHSRVHTGIWRSTQQSTCLSSHQKMWRQSILTFPLSIH